MKDRLGVIGAVGIAGVVMALGVPAMSAAHGAHLARSHQRIQIVGFCLSKRGDAVSCAGLHTIKPGSTVSECTSSEYSTLLTKIKFSGVSTSRNLPYRVTFAGPGGADGPGDLGFSKHKGKETLFDNGFEINRDPAGHLIPGVYSVTIARGSKKLAHRGLTITGKSC